jgi:mono/diheme cytochrome c family protein
MFLKRRGFASSEGNLLETRLGEGREFSRAAMALKRVRSIAPAVGFFFAQSCLVVVTLAPLLSSHARADTPPAVYKSKCSACHGVKGAGDTMLGKNLNLRPLGSPDVQEQSDDELFVIISKGKKKKRMPAFENRLSRDQIGDLVRYIRSLK